jgi:D-amino-acid dehydrogenase
MRVIVVGAGVVGVATAYYLALDGHEVEVFESGDRAAGASGVNAGLLVPGDSVVWATPRAPVTLARSLLGRGHAGIVVRRSAGWSLVPWGARFLRECLPDRNASNVRAAHALSTFSLSEMKGLIGSGAVRFELTANGMLFLFRDERSRTAALAARRQLREVGETYRALSAGDLVALDPAFAATADRYPFALHTPGSASGDCRAFTFELVRLAQALGVAFSERAAVRSIAVSSGRFVSVVTDHGPSAADALVIAAGADSANLARTAGLRLPIEPARGYSATVPIIDSDRVPMIGGVAEDQHVAFSRTSTHLRISSTAEFSGHDRQPDPTAHDSIRRLATLLFGSAVDWSRATYHSGLRPMTPAGLPLIGPTRVAGLFVNAGHSHLGWTQACGSARLLADQVAGRTPEIDTRPYAPDSPARRPSPAATIIPLPSATDYAPSPMRRLH